MSKPELPNLFNRYHHQKKRVIEYSAAVNVGISKHNKASVNFRNNEVEYETPFGNYVDSENVFGFSNNFETSDELAFGFSGTINLDADNYTFRRRSVYRISRSLYERPCFEYAEI